MLIICRDQNTALAKVASQVSLTSPDTIIMTATGPFLGIEEVRELRRALSLRPLKEKHKTAVIPAAEKLTIEAQNALLKILEEPPEDADIILIAPEEESLLPTVVSRCQVNFLTSTTPKLSPQDKTKAQKVLNLIATQNLAAGFAWVKSVGSKRDEAVGAIDQLLIASADLATPAATLKLLNAKRYLQASTNVRLTLENLFL
ncbi:hypothetical protein HY440_02040 [Candidatus Microgenomates bacterium]|nr:hypothetical protein [Candidatus Microgenomates bacterium]